MIYANETAIGRVGVIEFPQETWQLVTSELTNIRRQVFSLSAPTHPAKPMINITVPTMMKMRPGSTKNVVNCPILWNISFSTHAHSPIPRIPNPKSYIRRKQARELRSKIIYSS